VVLVFINGRMAISIKEISSMIKDKDTVKCTGWMVRITKANGKMGYKMGMEN
jgi:hypothetical protein